MNKTYTYEELYDMTKNELFAICNSMNIDSVEYNDYNYDDLVDLILDTQEIRAAEEAASSASTATSVQANIAVNIVNPDGAFGERTNTFVSVSCGGSSEMFNGIGKTAGSIMELLTDALNIPTNPMILVNGATVGPDYVLQASDRLEFSKPSGAKGC